MAKATKMHLAMAAKSGNYSYAVFGRDEQRFAKSAPDNMLSGR
jgi:hypothetical protein